MLACSLVFGVSLPAAAQWLPNEPIAFEGGRVTLGGDISASFSCADAVSAGSRLCPDDTGFFNYGDYRDSMVRMLRVDIAAAVKATDRFSILAEVRSDDGARPEPYALYLRFRPWTTRGFDVQVGRVPPTFGAFARRTYAADNLLIGYPLAYQYLTSLRPDSLPANADELLSMRGRGWQSSFSVGNTTPASGTPLAGGAFQWDTGVQLHATNQTVDAAFSVTGGSLGDPTDSAGKQVAARLAIHPTPGLILGLSGSEAPYVTRDAARSAGVENISGNFTQAAWGADVEYSRDYYLVRFETVVSDWRLPILGTPVIELPLRATASFLEGRYKIRPGLYVAARLDHLGFSEITGSSQRTGWDAPVSRTEIGGGYSLQRNLLLKLSVQHNARPAGRTMNLNLVAAQVVFWI
jgi:hypothetical protein